MPPAWMFSALGDEYCTIAGLDRGPHVHLRLLEIRDIRLHCKLAPASRFLLSRELAASRVLALSLRV